MRPPVADIAIPPLPADLPWIGAATTPRIKRLAAVAPVLVHFFDFAQLNSVRTLPYLHAWHDRYREAGLVVLGVHSPRFPFTASRDAVAAAISRLAIPYAVALDSGFQVWRAYGCEGWPSLFLWGCGGALRWYHFGEGEYRATEEAIQEELREADALRELPQPMQPLRPTDAPDARVMPPTPELFPAGEGKAWEPREGERELALEYEAGGAHATLEGAGELALELDGVAQPPIAVDGAALYELAAHPRHEGHSLVLRPSPGLRVWSVSFEAGIP
jgi:hypothetical protein